MIENPDIPKIKAEIKFAKSPAIDHPSKDPSGRMSTQNIVLHFLRKQGKEKHFKNTYAKLHQMLAGNDYRLLREGNTLFLIHILEKSVCEIAILNADTTRNLVINFYGFLKALEKAAYKKVYMDSKSDKIMHELHSRGFDIKNVNDGRYLLEL